MRKTDYPVSTFQNIHHSGITSISWCPADPSLVVSTGRDERTVVTNFKTREMVMEFPRSNRTYDTILWSKHLNGKIAAVDSEGNTDLLSVHPQSTQQVGEPRQDDAEPAFAKPIPSQ